MVTKHHEITILFNTNKPEITDTDLDEIEILMNSSKYIQETMKKHNMIFERSHVRVIHYSTTDEVAISFIYIKSDGDEFAIDHWLEHCMMRSFVLGSVVITPKVWE